MKVRKLGLGKGVLRAKIQQALAKQVNSCLVTISNLFHSGWTVLRQAQGERGGVLYPFVVSLSNHILR